MKKIAVMCGGDSSERQVSAQSALNVMDHIDREKYLPRLVFIEGINWYVLPSSARTLEDILVHSGCPVIDKNRFSFQDPETGKYYLNMKICRLAERVRSRIRDSGSAVAILHGFVVQACELFDESAHLVQRQDDHIVYRLKSFRRSFLPPIKQN